MGNSRRGIWVSSRRPLRYALMPDEMTALHRRNGRAPSNRDEPFGAGLTRFFLVGYASVEAIMQLRRAGAGADNHDTCLGVVLNGSRLRRAPEVFMAAGLGLIGPVIRTSREAV